MADKDDKGSPKRRSTRRSRKAVAVDHSVTDSPDARRRDESFYTPQARPEDSNSSAAETEDEAVADSGVSPRKSNRRAEKELESSRVHTPSASPAVTRSRKVGSKDAHRPPDIGWNSDFVPTPSGSVKPESLQTSRPPSNGSKNLTFGAVAVAFLVLFLGLIAITKGFPSLVPQPKIPPNPAVIAQEGIVALRAKFLQQNVATWGTLNDVVQYDFRKGRGPATLLLVSEDPSTGAATAQCLADGISRLMNKIATLSESEEPGMSIDFDYGNEQSFHNAAAQLRTFEATRDIPSVMFRNIQSIRYDHFVLLLQGASDPDSAVRKDAGVIFVADLDPNKTAPSTGRQLSAKKPSKGLAEYQASLPDNWDLTRKKTEAWKRWARDAARSGLENAWSALRAESNGAGVPVEKVGPVLSRIAGTRVIYVLPEERLPLECR